MRRFTSLLITLFIATALFVWGAERIQDAWEPELRHAIETAASKSLGIDVHITHLRYRFPLALRITQVEAAPIFRADDITVYLNLFNLPSAIIHTQPLESIGFIRLNHPQIRLTEEQLRRFKRVHTLEHAAIRSPFFGVSVKNGLIEYENPQAIGHPWTLQSIDGVFQWRGPQQSLTIDARSPPISALHLDYSVFGRRWKGNLSIEDLDIEKMAEHIAILKGASVFPKGVSVSGHADLSLNAGGKSLPQSVRDLSPFVNSLHWQISHAKVKMNGRQIPWDSHGALVGRQEGFVFEKTFLRLDESPWAFTGTVTPLSAAPTIDLQARSQNSEAADILRLFQIKDVLLGKGDLILRVKGALVSPHVSIQALFPEALLVQHPIRDLSLFAIYEDGGWELRDSGFRMDAGRIHAQGTLQDGELALHATADQLSLETVTAQPALKGTFSGAIEMDGATDDWELRGSWWASHMAWNEKPLSPGWRGDVQAQHNGRIQLNGDTEDNRFHLHAQGLYQKSILQLTEALLELPGGKQIRAEGDESFAEKTANFNLHSDELIFNLQTFKNLTVRGRWAAPSLMMTVSGQRHASDDPDPAPATFSGTLHYEPRHMVVDHFQYQRNNMLFDTQASLTLGITRVPFNGTATVHVTGSRSVMEVPVIYQGTIDTNAGGRGNAHLVSGPLKADLSWEQPDDITLQASLEKGGWNTAPLTMNLEGHWKQHEDSSLALHGTLDPGGQMEASVKLRGRHLTIDNAAYRTPESRLEIQPGGTVDFPVDSDVKTHLSATLRNLHLGFLTFFGSLDLDGQWARGSDHAILSAQAKTRSLFINDYELEEGQILARWENGILHFTAPEHSPGLIQGDVDFQQRPQLIFKHLLINGKEGQHLDIDGEVGPSHWDYALDGKGLDLGILGELSGLAIPMSGAADLRIIGHGDSTHPNVEGHARIQEGRIADVHYESGETDLIWQEDRITFQNLRLKDGDRYSAVGGGVFPIRSHLHPNMVPKINFTVRLQDTNLGFLQSIYPEIKSARGAVEGLVQIEGTLDNPEFRGHLSVEDGDIVGAHYFRRLKNLKASIDFDHDHLRINELRARAGDGELNAGGDVTLTGFYPSNFNLHAETLGTQPIEIEVPELAIPDSPLAKRFKFLTSVSRVNVNARVQFTGSTDAPSFQGKITLSNGRFTFPPQAKKSASSPLSLWARRIVWDVDLYFQNKAWFENELVEANVNGTFHIKGAGDALMVDGGLAIPQGKISYLGLQFDIREARFDMKAGVPFLSGEAESQVEATDSIGLTGGVNTSQRFSVEDTITLHIPYGPLDQIKPKLTSGANPSLSQEKVLARVTQLDVENLTPQERTYLYQQQAVSLIDNSLTTPLAQKVLKRTGIADRFRSEHVFDPSAAPPVDPITGQATRGTTAADLFANTKYTVEKDVSSKLSVGYGVRFIPAVLADTNQRKLDLVSDLQLSYRAFKNVYVRGNYDLPNSNPGIIPDKRVTIEPRWRFGWWGNTNPKPKPKSQ
jgi:hypothetical protein